jgi:hypothetical protein
VEIKLHVGRARHVLQRHTTASLSAARQVNRALRLLPHDQVTHFVPDLQLPADQVQLLLVSIQPLRPIPPIQRLPILLLVKLHVPQNAVRTVLERKRANGTISRFPHPALLAAGAQDDGTDPELAVDVEDFTDFSDAAAACVFQHGELCNIGGVSAATVKSHILWSRGLSDLANHIQNQLKDYLSGKGPNWVEEVPYSTLDPKSPPMSRYVWSQRTQQWMLAPIQDSLRKVKNDPQLQSSATNAGNYTVLNGITAVGSPQSGDAPTRLRGVNLAAARPRRLGDSDTAWTVNNYTPEHGFTYNNDVEFKAGTFSASFTNSWLRWLSLYVQFLGLGREDPSGPGGVAIKGA